MSQQKRITLQNAPSWRTGKLTSLLTLLLFLAGVSPRLAAQANEWTWMSGSNSTNQPGVYGTLGVPAAGNVPGARWGSAVWTDSSGNLWLFGGNTTTGGNCCNFQLNDLWKYTPATEEWTWMSGGTRTNQLGVYGTLGVPAAGNVPGGRDGAASWMDGSGNLWLFGGWGYVGYINGNYDWGNYNDLWKYTPATGEWTWMGGSNVANQPGVYGTLGVPAAGNVPGARSAAASSADANGNFWLFGGASMNDLWKYTPSTGEWTWMSGSNVANQPGVYGTLGVPAAGNVPGARNGGAVSWTDASGNFWLFGGGGYDANGNCCVAWNDLWRYAPSTGEWTWISGSNSTNQPGVYGTLGVPAAGNVPGGRWSPVSWTDLSGNLWLFGGTSGPYIELNDLWKYTPSTGEWTWMSGSNTAGQGGVYGTLGVPAAGNGPGARHGAVSWMLGYGNLWLFGGLNGLQDTFNDLWRYTPTPPALTPSLTAPAPGSTLSGSTVTFAWSNPGNIWTQFMLRLGTTGVGSSDVYNGAATAGTSVQVSGIPANGASLYARLSYYVNGDWQYVDSLYTEAGTPTSPALTMPIPGSTLSGSTVNFAWSNPGGHATRFVLRLGTTGLGASDVFSGAANTGTSEHVNAIPTNGAYLYATLWYYLNGKWQYANARYTEAGTPTPPAMTAPAPGSTLPGSTVTFGWDPGAGPTRFVLRLGTTFPGSMDVYSGGSTTATSVQLTTIPTTGAKLYARLWYFLNETWKYVDATYTEAGK